MTEVLFLLSSFEEESGTGIECETGLELGTDMSTDFEEAPGSNNLSKAITEKVGMILHHQTPKINNKSLTLPSTN